MTGPEAALPAGWLDDEASREWLECGIGVVARDITDTPQRCYGADARAEARQGGGAGGSGEDDEDEGRRWAWTLVSEDSGRVMVERYRPGPGDVLAGHQDAVEGCGAGAAGAGQVRGLWWCAGHGRVYGSREEAWTACAGDAGVTAGEILLGRQAAVLAEAIRGHGWEGKAAAQAQGWADHIEEEGLQGQEGIDVVEAMREVAGSDSWVAGEAQALAAAWAALGTG